MAMERSVVATKMGGPPEFVTPAAGLLVDPEDGASLAVALDEAVSLPSPNPAARQAAGDHDVKVMATRMADVLARAITAR
jgi:glycosyltransferase involved in cell wall biosynthesis